MKGVGGGLLPVSGEMRKGGGGEAEHGAASRTTAADGNRGSRWRWPRGPEPARRPAAEARSRRGELVAREARRGGWGPSSAWIRR